MRGHAAARRDEPHSRPVPPLIRQASPATFSRKGRRTTDLTAPTAIPRVRNACPFNAPCFSRTVLPARVRASAILSGCRYPRVTEARFQTVQTVQTVKMSSPPRSRGGGPRSGGGALHPRTAPACGSEPLRHGAIAPRHLPIAPQQGGDSIPIQTLQTIQTLLFQSPKSASAR